MEPIHFFFPSMGSNSIGSRGNRLQKTLKKTIFFEGKGIHSGMNAQVFVHPAPPNNGIVFLRKDSHQWEKIPAHFDSVVATQMATTLGKCGKESGSIATVEHLMASFYGVGITNALVEVSGPEIPILDGSANPFVEAILDAGIETQKEWFPVIQIKKPIKIFQNKAICELLPRKSLRLTISIDFPHPLIQNQTFAVEINSDSFVKEVAKARTFGFLEDLEKLKQVGLARGASLENVLAFDQKAILNKEGARFPDECVRHKMLDAFGDLALFGAWIEGEFISSRGGHSIHIALLKALKQNPLAWEFKNENFHEINRDLLPIQYQR